jgi:hypothetical protein
LIDESGMARGGKRPGAGRPKGTKDPQTKARQIVEEEFRAFMLRERKALWRAQLARALGTFVVMEVRKDGTYGRVTDPLRIEQLMAKPEGERYFIEAQAPDTQLVKEINNRTMGVPTQPHELAGADGAPLSVTIVHQELKEDA